jgi:hypothetical protein
MSIISFLSGAVKPITDLVDSLHTSGEEKGKLVNELTKMENDLAMKVLEYEAKIMELQTSVIKSEAEGSSWLQKSWRPITMLTFLMLVVLDSFGWLANRLAPEAWTLLQVGLGGYVVGRTIEKVAPSMMEKFGKK